MVEVVYNTKNVIHIGLDTLVRADGRLYIIVRNKQIWPRSVVLVL